MMREKCQGTTSVVPKTAQLGRGLQPLRRSDSRINHQIESAPNGIAQPLLAVIGPRQYLRK